MSISSPRYSVLGEGLRMYELREPQNDASVLLFVHGMAAAYWRQYKAFLDAVAGIIYQDMGLVALEWDASYLTPRAIETVQERYCKTVHLLTHSFGSTILEHLSAPACRSVRDNMGDAILLTPAGIVHPSGLTAAMMREVGRALHELMQGNADGNRCSILLDSMIGAARYISSSGIDASMHQYKRLAMGNVDIKNDVRSLQKDAHKVVVVGAQNDPIFPAYELGCEAESRGMIYNQLLGTHVCPVTRGKHVAKSITPMLRDMHR